jgi:hypothetical protein
VVNSYHPLIRSLTLGSNTKPGGGGTNFPVFKRILGWGEWMVLAVHGYFQSQARQLTSSAFVWAIFWSSIELFDDPPETVCLEPRRLIPGLGAFTDLCRQAHRKVG